MRAEQAAHRRSEDKIAEMAVELKNAADRYEILEKENQANSADLKKALDAAKETRSESRDAREELLIADEVFGSEVCSPGSTLEPCRHICGFGEEYS